MALEHVVAFAPGRANLIGEHTDYNGGLALPFALVEGTTVRASAAAGGPERELLRVRAFDLDEDDEFLLAAPTPASGWRAYVRGVAAELVRAGFALRGGRLEITGEVPHGAGLSSSASLEVAVCLALIELGGGPGAAVAADRVALARLCSRAENEWAGARTGLLDQLAALYGCEHHALCIDFASLDVEPVPLHLGAWTLAVLDSGERHMHASSGYNERRAECARACELLGVATLSEAREADLARLPEPLRDRAAHVLGENARVRAAVAALRDGELAALGPLLDASHASLRDLYDVSTPAVEATVARMRAAGASGTRLVGGGFGGGVLGLFAPGREPPAQARRLRVGAGAQVLDAA